MYQQLRSEIGTFRSELATMEQHLISTIRAIPSEMATKSEIGTLTNRSELDILISRPKQETLEQMQKQRGEQTTTLNETVNHMNEKLDDKIKVIDGQLSRVKSSVSTHATSMETIKITLDAQVKQSSDPKQKN